MLAEMQMRALADLSGKHFEIFYKSHESLIRKMMIEEPKTILKMVFQTGFAGGYMTGDGQVECDCETCKQFKNLGA